ncbi:MAG: XkdX family protein [Paenibacillaceae bacterium]|nr:XkdX family protein [Paenibacillaceae bacterium]
MSILKRLSCVQCCCSFYDSRFCVNQVPLWGLFYCSKWDRKWITAAEYQEITGKEYEKE